MGVSSQDFLRTALLRLGNQLISLKKVPSSLEALHPKPYSGVQLRHLVSILLGRSRTFLGTLLVLEPPSHLPGRSHMKFFMRKENMEFTPMLYPRDPKEVGGGP